MKTSQVNKVKNIENKMHELLSRVSKCNSVSEVKKCTVGGVEKRIDNRTKMTDTLTEAMGDMTKSASSALVRPASNEREEATSCEPVEHSNTNGDQPQRRVPHKIRYKRLDTGNLQEAIFNKYYIVKFNEQSKRQVNPYAVINKIEELTGCPPKPVTGNNRVSFTVEVHSANQREKITKLQEVEGFPCEVEKHSKFYYSKRIIHIKEFDITNTEDFKIYLQENDNVADVTAATFIKIRDPKTQAF